MTPLRDCVTYPAPSQLDLFVSSLETYSSYIYDADAGDCLLANLFVNDIFERGDVLLISSGGIRCHPNSTCSSRA
ncbi:hypothetical protein AURDEDRAFT_163514 [Auricularia subglabra TFB-10046 SS5]|nr:hypothetical protein AURDEDRAFT_163514 [Auricularia subglabra TFB-10046 SS5]